MKNRGMSSLLPGKGDPAVDKEGNRDQAIGIREQGLGLLFIGCCLVLK